MNQFNLGNFINRFQNTPQPNQNLRGGGGMPPNNPNVEPEAKFQVGQNNVVPQPQSGIIPSQISRAAANNSFNQIILNDLRMNQFATMERSLYIKDLMNLPKEIEESITLLQSTVKQTQDQEVVKLLTTNIDLLKLNEIIKQGGKDAIGKLILEMANASKQGITDLSQIKDTIRLINASISVPGQDNPSQVLKNFMLLYLPWLPLKEGVDFEMEVEGSEEEASGSASSLSIMISTRNFGNVNALLTLEDGNSVGTFITCAKEFPKDELLKRIKSENQRCSIKSNVVVEQKEVQLKTSSDAKAKVNLSSPSEISPILVMMAHTVIKLTIELDNEAG